MATKAKKRPRSKAHKERARQAFIEGMEPPSFPDIDAAADEYREVRDRRMELTEEEGDARKQLGKLMKDHGLMSYRYDDYLVEVSAEESVKVKKAPKEKPPAEANGQAEE